MVEAAIIPCQTDEQILPLRLRFIYTHIITPNFLQKKTIFSMLQEVLVGEPGTPQAKFM